MKRSGMSYQLVEYIPERLEDGVLYVSQRYGTAAHRCCCGCGEEVITPLGPTDWSVKLEGSVVTLHPSIGNWSFACRSHYWIRGGKVIWAGPMSQSLINQGRARDKRIKQAYFDEVNRNKQGGLASHSTQTQPQGLLNRLWQAIKHWMN